MITPERALARLQEGNRRFVAGERRDDRVHERLEPLRHGVGRDLHEEPRDLDPERQVAEWVLSRGGEVTRHPYGEITRREDLPPEPFRIRKIYLWKRGVTDDGLAQFARLSVLEGVTLSGNPLAMTAGLWALGRLSPKLYRYLGRLGSGRSPAVHPPPIGPAAQDLRNC